MRESFSLVPTCMFNPYSCRCPSLVLFANVDEASPNGRRESECLTILGYTVEILMWDAHFTAQHFEEIIGRNTVIAFSHPCGPRTITLPLRIAVARRQRT